MFVEWWCWSGGNKLGPGALKWLGSWINGDTTQTELGPWKSSLLAQFAAAVTASRCWPPDWDTKSYNWRREWGERGEAGGDGLNMCAGGVWGERGKRAADTNKRRAQGPDCEATALRSSQLNRRHNTENYNGGCSADWIMANGSEMSACPSHVIYAFDLCCHVHLEIIPAKSANIAVLLPWK